MADNRHLNRAAMLSLAGWAALLSLAPGASAAAQTPVNSGSSAAQSQLTFADIVTYADAADVVAVVQIRSQAVVEPARAPGLAPGWGRLYVKARTEALLGGRSALGESLAYLVDVPLTASGKAPKLGKKRFVVFADSVVGRPGELRLVAPHAQFATDEVLEGRVREVVSALSRPDAPPRITRIRDVISVRGNLAGESETQLFVETDSGEPVSISVVHRPGAAAQWGASWSEIVDQSDRPPESGTIEWFRLACSLPPELPASAHLQSDRSARYQADADYRFVLDQLGPCTRNTM